MVKNKNKRDQQPESPYLDESWWEAVLAEEESKGFAVGGRKPAVESANPKDQRLPADPQAVDWSKARELYENDLTIHLEVISFNRGGLLVNGSGLQGFVPISHLVDAPVEVVETEEWLARYHGQTLYLKVIECDPERGRVVFSERAALAEPGVRNSLLQRLKPGDCVNGAVTNITDFGVFVDLGGVEGLIHVSEISWGRVHHPNDVVMIGQDLRVHVIQVDRERARIALSLKRLYPNPWVTAESRYHVGQVTDAVITSIVPFGAFARLEEGLDGLIHISEIDGSSGSLSLDEKLHEGQAVRVRILHVDAARQRLGLSLKLTDEVYEPQTDDLSGRVMA